MEVELDTVIAMNNMEATLRGIRGVKESIYPVCCDCGWFGMADDCQHMLCPSCGAQVRRDNTHNEEVLK